jgi:AraC family transcriptional regulator, regulatory protein of adaptative response / methylated-DNA-[protein]-cysteine methyltransferase
MQKEISTYLTKELLSTCLAPPVPGNTYSGEPGKGGIPIAFEITQTKAQLHALAKIISWGWGSTPYGRCCLARTDRGIMELHFIEAASFDNPHGPAPASDFPGYLGREFPGSTIVQDQAGADEIIHAVFFPQKRTGRKPVRLLVYGTEFQVNVWKALLHIPPGTVTSYNQLAHFIGKREACRAVGTALAHNRIAYLIPCHRVIKKTGEPGEYRWGKQRKLMMLAREFAARGIIHPL